MEENSKPIGIFDSGLGGLSVLKEAIKLLPYEDFIYYGDTKNAPYGTKSVNEIRKLTNSVVDFLLDKEVKAIVIACNTATSASVDELRKRYSLPIIGIEPALKPAVELNRKGKIIIMATTVTLSEKKFKNLMEKYKKDCNIVPLPCPGLMEFIESGNIDSLELEEYLKGKLNKFTDEQISSIVLGCTHYPFIKNKLSQIVGEHVPIIDGSMGTSMQLKRQLEKASLLNNRTVPGKLTIYNSLDTQEIIELSYKLISI
ncbi:glutamate racemase [Haloimpatiens massiliensis]|uniref:glutamate racemase n=1 Tax=Haloimpatiens massiliensis TaxID=1658110 RepID=UPI000C83DCEA|nr:glutamate racemase [Haloimpatiens massiliensis]